MEPDIELLERVVHKLLQRVDALEVLVENLQNQVAALRSPHIRPTIPAPPAPPEIVIEMDDSWTDDMTTPVVAETTFIDPFSGEPFGNPKK